MAERASLFTRAFCVSSSSLPRPPPTAHPHPGPVAKLVMSEIADVTAGAQLHVSVTAFEQNNNVCASGVNNYSATLGLSVTGKAVGNAVM